MSDDYESGRNKGYWGATPPNDISNHEAMRGYYDGVREKERQDGAAAQHSSGAADYTPAQPSAPVTGYLPDFLT
ncbi:MAG: hypothetical protein ACRCUT_11170, partial [Spirochaetota bacterium]